MTDLAQRMANHQAALMTWQDTLTALLSGPYVGWGGAAALARDLGIHTQTLKAWRAGRVEPNYDNRQRLAALLAERGEQK